MLFPPRNEEKKRRDKTESCYRPSSFRGSAFVQSPLGTINRILFVVHIQRWPPTSPNQTKPNQPILRLIVWLVGWSVIEVQYELVAYHSASRVCLVARPHTSVGTVYDTTPAVRKHFPKRLSMLRATMTLKARLSVGGLVPLVLHTHPDMR